MIMKDRQNALRCQSGHRLAPAIRQPAVRLFLFCALLSGAALSQAQQNENSSMARSIADAEAHLMEQEEALGRFDTGLIEPLRSLAELQMSAGRFNAAESLLSRQLEIQRVNLGLHSAAQIPVLESLISLHVARGDWEEARDTVSHLVWIHSRSDDINAGEHLDGLLRARAWLMLLLQRDSSDREARHLLMYKDISEQMKEVVEERFDQNDPRQLPFLYESSKADMAIALTIMQNPLTGQQIIEREEGIRSSRPLRASYPITSAADLERVYGTKAATVTDRSFRNYMRGHASTIDDMIDIARANEDEEAEAMLTLYRGDATLLRQQYERRPGRIAGPQRGRGSTGTASTHYRDALEQLRDLGHDEEALMSRFGCPSLLPVDSLYLELEEYPACSLTEDGNLTLESDKPVLGSRLPGFSYQTQQLPAGENNETISGTLALRIGTNGQVSSSDIIEPFPDGSSHHSELRRLIANLQFRPALEPDGSATRTSQLRMVVHLDSHD